MNFDPMTPKPRAPRDPNRVRGGALRVLAGAVAGAILATVVVAVVGSYLITMAPRPAPLPESALPEPPLGVAQQASLWAPPLPSGAGTITVAAVGDMIFDRQVAVLISREGAAAPLAPVAERLAAADVAVGNLESMLSSRGTAKTDKYVFRGVPAGAKSLASAGFDLVSIANNHTLDYGEEALFDTIDLLEAEGIGHAGAGRDADAAWKPAVLEVGRASVAYLAFSSVLPTDFPATDSRAGVAPGRGAMDRVDDAIRAAKDAYDYVFVSFHWGIEGEDHATAEQIRDAQRAVDAGADLVLAHHPHVIQAIEMYEGSLIAYSLGDFVFDHYSRKTGEAFVLEVDVGPHGIANARMTPVYLDGYGRPEYVTGDEASVILERLRAVSERRGCTIDIDGDVGRVVIE